MAYFSHQSCTFCVDVQFEQLFKGEYKSIISVDILKILQGGRKLMYQGLKQRKQN
jgi:hypothetical protein